MKFNANNYIRVKLTDVGRDALLVHCLQSGINLVERFPEDEDGYTEIQLWQAMNIFGPQFRHGSYIPFDMNIEIPDGSHD